MVLLLVCSQVLKIFSEIENHTSQIINKLLGKNWGGGGGGVECRGEYTPYNWYKVPAIIFLKYESYNCLKIHPHI